MRVSSISTLFGFFALSSSALAHFTLDYPQTRGFDEDLEVDNFCGGFHNVSNPRAPWYYKNGPIEIDSHHDSATVNIYISFEVPTSAQSFLKTSNGTALPTLRNDLALTGQGEFCFHANASNLNVAGVNPKDGTNATIMVEFISNVHGHLYQCSDVTFTSDQSVGANITCTDSLTASPSASGSDDDAAANSTASAANPSSTSSGKANDAMSAAVMPWSITLLAPVILVTLSGLL